jgi:hypothetical protein
VVILLKYPKEKSLFPQDDEKSRKRAERMIPEAQILKDITQWLTLKGYLWWRMPIGPVIRGGGKNGVRFSKNPLKVFPDLAGILDNKTGRFFACELKRDGCKESPEQRAWIDALNSHGAKCFISRSLDEFIEQIGEKNEQAQ